jgi:hypothetical protein
MAETLFESAAVGLAELRKGDWTDTVAPGTELEVRVKSPETRHTVTLAQL